MKGRNHFTSAALDVIILKRNKTYEDERICGELCVNVNESAAKPLIKGTGRMRVFDSARGFVRLNGQGIKRGERVRVELFRN